MTAYERIEQVTVNSTFLSHQDEIDHEFWSDLFKVVNNKRAFRIEIKTPDKEEK